MAPKTLGPTASAPAAGQQEINEADIEAVVETLRASRLTTGPRVTAFEEAFAKRCQAAEAVAVSSGTAALHAAVAAVGIGSGDEVIVPPLTFVATANVVLAQGAVPVFADVDPKTLLLDPEQVEKHLSVRTKAVLAVDYAGQPCDYARLRAITERRGIALIADACHALGAEDQGRPVGALADLSAFSFHPVKAITTGEGGMVTTQRADWAKRMRCFRNHDLSAEYQERERQVSWHYSIESLGFNYRLTDIACALGFSQLSRLDAFLARRRTIARRYEQVLAGLPGVVPLALREGVTHAYHLFVIQIDPDSFGTDRKRVFEALRAEGIGANVHYIPVHLQPLYRRRLGSAEGDCPVAEAAYERILSLPIFPRMEDEAVDHVAAVLRRLHKASGSLR